MFKFERDSEKKIKIIHYINSKFTTQKNVPKKRISLVINPRGNRYVEKYLK